MTDSLRDTIAPKSDQLNADDLLCGPITVTIRGVKRGSSDEQPVDIDIGDKHQPYKPCKSMRRVLISLWGDDPAKWIGRVLTLKNDPSVVYGGVKVGGIRIAAMSDIEHASVDVMLTIRRGMKAPYRVTRIDRQLDNYPDDRFSENLPKWVDAVKSGSLTTSQIIERCQSVAPLSSEQIRQIESITQ
jgi:hypothetical protein